GGRRPGDRGVQPLVPPPDTAPGRAGTRLTPGPFAAGRPKRPHPPRRAGHAPPAGLFAPGAAGARPPLARGRLSRYDKEEIEKTEGTLWNSKTKQGRAPQPAA